IRSPISNPGTRISGRRRSIMQSIWAVITLLALGLVLTGIPVRYEKVRMADPNIRDAAFHDLMEAGVSPEIAASYDVALGIILFAIMFTIGTFIFLRRSDSLLTSQVSIALILLGANFSGINSVHRTTDVPLFQPLPGLLATLVAFLQTAFVLFSV